MTLSSYPCYSWPLDFDNGITSTFQEFRSNHFHAGIDLRTFRLTGFPVRAVADGELVKIGMFWNNSGKSITLRHRDGNVTRYYHLDRFCPIMESLVSEVRQQTGMRYFGDYILPVPLAVRRGDVLAFSGETGVGFPHLHFEVRNASGEALNPLFFVRPTLADCRPPFFNSALVTPGSDSWVNGSMERLKTSLLRHNGSFAPEKPLVIVGTMELALAAADISSAGKMVVPYSLTACLDDRLYFDLHLDRFLPASNRQLGLLYDLDYSASSLPFFNLSWQNGLQLEVEKVSLPDWLNSLAAGKHDLEVMATDFQGNSTSANIPIIRLSPIAKLVESMQLTEKEIALHLAVVPLSADGRVKVCLLDSQGAVSQVRLVEALEIPADRTLRIYWDKALVRAATFLEVSYTFQQIPCFRQRFCLAEDKVELPHDVAFAANVLDEHLQLLLRDFPLPADHIQLKLRQGEDNLIVAARDCPEGVYFSFVPGNNENRLELRFVLLQSGRAVAEIQKILQIMFLQPNCAQRLQGKDFHIDFAPAAVAEAKVLLWQRETYAAELPMLSEALNLVPSRFSFLDAVRLNFSAQVAVSNPQQVGIFRYFPTVKRWRYLLTELNDGGRSFATTLPSGGIYCLLRDDSLPVIHFVRPRTHWLKFVKTLLIKIWDRGKGVDGDSIRIRVNGVELPVDYDLDRHCVKLEHPANLRRGSNRIEVEVQDYGGNRNNAAWDYFLR